MRHDPARTICNPLPCRDGPADFFAFSSVISDTTMSDTDDTSDGFDKEAERRKLEEKYGDEADQREDTQRMSELLLQGATMTNRHCDTCGSPIFRQNGQEFCPTCSAAGNGSAGAEGHQSPDPSNRPAASDNPRAGGTQRTAGTDGSAASNDEVHRNSQSAPSASGPDTQDRTQSAAPSDDDPRSSPATVDAGADLGEARRTLIQALDSHATAGATADDPRRARDHLAAAREAAEALAALR